PEGGAAAGHLAGGPPAADAGRAARWPGPPAMAEREHGPLPAPGTARVTAGAGERRAGRADAAGMVRAGVAGPGNRKPVPRRHGHSVSGPFGTGVSPLVPPVLAADRRHPV